MNKSTLLALAGILTVCLQGCASAVSPVPVPVGSTASKGGKPNVQAILAQVPVAPRLAQQPSLNLKGYQEPNGLIITFKGGVVADPYFGLYSLELAHRAGIYTSEADRAFLAWGLQNQRTDGRFDRQCKDSGEWKACGRADSDDATLARWLQLLARVTPGALPSELQRSFDQAEAALFKLKMPAGTFSVFPPGTPGYAGYALFKDNVEVLNAFEGLAQTFDAKKDSRRAQRFAKEAKALRAAIETQFGADAFNMKALALGARYDRVRFYPHKVAVPFGWMEGYYPAPSSAQWNQWLKGARDEWYANAKTDFPWGLMAVAAVATGPREEGHAWLKAHAGLRKNNERWNVLEEVSAQILEHTLQPK